jgi:hypothetical protein
MIDKLPKSLNLILTGALIIQFAGCGTLLYPERKGQKGGHIDVGVAVLDGIGLFFFLIPGIIAYAVDFSNGTIYLPGGLSALDSGNLKEVKFDPKHDAKATVEKIILEQTGQAVSLDHPDQNNMQVIRMKTKEDLLVAFGQALPEMQNAKIASLR